MTSPGRAIAGLRRLRDLDLPTEHCESCAVGLGAMHKHMVDCSSQMLFCICDICAMMLGSRAETRFRAVPRGVHLAPGFRLSDSTWATMGIPVAFAFIYVTEEKEAIAVYPSPAGAISSAVEREPWNQLVSQNPVLASLLPYVEALVINRVNSAREYLIAPIDECYALVGIVRREWRGFGGFEALDQVTKRMREMRERAA
jgi:uncharacterized protein DUF5947